MPDNTDLEKATRCIWMHDCDVSGGIACRMCRLRAHIAALQTQKDNAEARDCKRYEDAMIAHRFIQSEVLNGALNGRDFAVTIPEAREKWKALRSHIAALQAAKDEEKQRGDYYCGRTSELTYALTESRSDTAFFEDRMAMHAELDRQKLSALQSRVDELEADRGRLAEALKSARRVVDYVADSLPNRLVGEDGPTFSDGVFKAWVSSSTIIYARDIQPIVLKALDKHIDATMRGKEKE